MGDSVEYGKVVEGMRDVFKTGRTKSIQWRTSQLQAAIRCLTEQREKLCQALLKDLRKSEFDSMVDEIVICVNEAKWFIKNLPRLMKDRKKSVDIANIGGSAYVHYEPLGVVLDIGAWNYPIQIPFSTMINIIAAGNCVVIKPSEISVNSAQLIADIVPKYFDTDCVKVIEGGVSETTALLNIQWDHVIYTGSANIGKIVYQAAAKYLTPCTLELGGKCPSYVSEGCDLEAVCNRIVWTKYKNAGQTCISVDYVLVQESVEEAFLQQMVKSVRQQYTDDPLNAADYSTIVNERHFSRIMGLLDGSPGKKIVLGGESDKGRLYIAPTMVTGVRPGDKLMQEEIFGPILPVLSVRDHKEAIEFINNRDKPLHLNLWTKNQAIIDEFVLRTSSGGVSVNDALIFRVEKGLPFGGVGQSGFGCYDGESGFENFSHKKAVLVKSQGMEFVNKAIRYGPHTPEQLKRLTTLLELPETLWKYFKGFLVFVPIAVLIGVAFVFGFGRDSSKAEL